MVAFILLRGKEFSLSDGASTAIIGLFFGLVCGLFYYQHYYKPFFWAISLFGGFALTYVTHAVIDRLPGIDSGSMEATLASFIIPFLLTLALNHGLYLIKRSKRRKHGRRKTHSTFFDSVDAHAILRTESARVAPDNVTGPKQ